MPTPEVLLQYLRVSDAGVLGLPWHASRQRVYEWLPVEARRPIEHLGPSFFSFTIVIIEQYSVCIGFRFTQGLTAVRLTPLLSVGGDVRAQLTTLLGSPDPEPAMRVTTSPLPRWTRGTTFLTADLRVQYSVSLTGGSAQGVGLPYTASADGSLQLEHFLAELTANRPAQSAGRAREIVFEERVMTGRCPRCGCAAGTWHVPNCQYSPTADACIHCRKYRSEIDTAVGRLCLVCAQHQALGTYMSRYNVHSASTYCGERRIDPEAILVERFEQLSKTTPKPTRKSEQVLAVCAATCLFLAWLLVSALWLVGAIALGAAWAILVRYRHRLEKPLSTIAYVLSDLRRWNNPPDVKEGNLISLELDTPLSTVVGRVVKLSEKGVASQLHSQTTLAFGKAEIISQPVGSQSAVFASGSLVSFSLHSGGRAEIYGSVDHPIASL